MYIYSIAHLMAGNPIKNKMKPELCGLQNINIRYTLVMFSQKVLIVPIKETVPDIFEPFGTTTHEREVTNEEKGREGGFLIFWMPSLL